MPVPITREYVEHNGVKYFRTKFSNGREYYYCSRIAEHGGKQKFLHRVLYEEAYGSLRIDQEIHHQDGDGLNNDLSNLAAVSRSEHVREHGCSGAWAESTPIRSARKKEEWTRRQPHAVVCVGCGTKYESTGQRAMFCSRPCRRRYYHRERGY